MIGLTAGARRGDDSVDELVEEPDLGMSFDPELNTAHLRTGLEGFILVLSWKITYNAGCLRGDLVNSKKVLLRLAV